MIQAVPAVWHLGMHCRAGQRIPVELCVLQRCKRIPERSPALTGKLTDRVKLVGATINCGGGYLHPEPQPHVQSYVVAMDQVCCDDARAQTRHGRTQYIPIRDVTSGSSHHSHDRPFSKAEQDLYCRLSMQAQACGVPSRSCCCCHCTAETAHRVAPACLWADTNF